MIHMDNAVMNPDNPKWTEFVEHLKTVLTEEQPRYKDDPPMWATFCNCTQELSHRVLREQFPEIDIVETFRYFHDHGGHCDCEILYNCARIR
jgi:hypothetical protein